MRTMPNTFVSFQPTSARHLLGVGGLLDHELDALSTPFNEAQVGGEGLMRGIVSFLFQQPSLRTHSSFAAAATMLGLNPVSITTTGGELRDQCDLEDEIIQLSMTSKVVVARTTFELVPERFRQMRCPLLNAGDAANEHPSQTLLDLTVLRTLGMQTSSHVVLLGNLKGHRVNHSLFLGLQRLGVRVTLLAPAGLQMPKRYFEAQGLASNVQELPLGDVALADEVLSTADFVYQSPLPAWSSPNQAPLDAHRLDIVRAARVFKKTARVLHPFPRHGELDASLDGSRYDAYTLQTSLGPMVRARLLNFVLRS